MHWTIQQLFAGLLVTLALFPSAKLTAQTASSQASEENIGRIRLEAFVRSDLPAAKEVASYTEELSQRIPGIDVVIHDVLNDRAQLKRLNELSKKFGREKSVVPSFYCCGRLYIGFTDAKVSGPRIEGLFTAEVYTRDTCPRCATAKAFIAQLKKRWPAIQFRIYEVTRDVAARRRWEELCRSRGQLPGLPTIEFADHVLIGYQGDNVTGAQLERLIEELSGTRDEPQPQPEDSSTNAVPRGFPFLPSVIPRAWVLAAWLPLSKMMSSSCRERLGRSWSYLRQPAKNWSCHLLARPEWRREPWMAPRHHRRRWPKASKFLCLERCGSTNSGCRPSPWPSV